MDPPQETLEPVEKPSLQTLIEQAPMSVQVFGADGRCLFANAAWEELWQVPRTEVLGYDVLRDPQLETKGVAALVKRAFAGESVLMPPLAYDPKESGKPGQPRWVEGRFFPVRDEGGSLRYVTLLLQDVTARLTAERDLHASRNMLQLVLDNVPQFVFWKDRELIYRGGNALFARANGFTRPEELVGKDDYDMGATREEADSFRTIDHRVMASGVAERGIVEPVTRPDGSRRWLRTSKLPLRDPNGSVVGILGTYEDITHEQEAEQARRRLETERYELLERLQTVLERMPIACALHDTEFCITYWNRAAERMFGWSFDEVAGHSFSVLERGDVASDEVAAVIPDVLRRLAAGEPEVQAVAVNVTKDGRRIRCEWIHAPLRRADGAFVGVISMAHDITERLRADDEIKRLNAELEQRVLDRTAELQIANRELESFAYTVSHDLRAPLRHVDGFIDLLRDRAGAALDPESQRYLAVISNSAKTLGKLIDALLAFSQMSRSGLAKERVDLRQVLDEVLEQLRPETADRDVTFDVSALPMISADRTLMKAVLLNLVSNALKFTRPRARAIIEVGASREGPATSVVFVRDNGVGFDPRYAHKLFGVFQRLHAATDFEGTGIGLANVRRIVQRHGGRAWATSAPDQGATFFFSLPDPADPSADEPPPGSVARPFLGSP